MDRVIRKVKNAVPLGERLLCDLREFETSGRSDLAEDIETIICKDGKKEFIHRLILRSASPVFAKILNESKTTGVISVDISADILRSIVDHIYSRQELSFSTTQALELFVAARRYEIGGLATSIGEAVDDEFLKSFLDDGDALTRISDRDILQVIELFDRVEMNSEQEYRLLRNLRAWAGTDKDRFPKLVELLDALNRPDRRDGRIAGPGRKKDGTASLLWRGNANGTVTLCGLRVGGDGKLSVDEITEAPATLAKGNFTMAGDVLVRLDGNTLETTSAYRASAGLVLGRLYPNYSFLGLLSTADKKIIAWNRRGIFLLSLIGNTLTEKYGAPPYAAIEGVHSIEGCSNRAPLFAIYLVKGRHGPCIEFVDCNSWTRITPQLLLPGKPLAISKDELVVDLGNDVFLYAHDFKECRNRRSLESLRKLSGAIIIDRSKVLVAGKDRSSGSLSVGLVDYSSGVKEQSSVPMVCKWLRLDSEVENQNIVPSLRNVL